MTAAAALSSAPAAAAEPGSGRAFSVAVALGAVGVLAARLVVNLDLAPVLWAMLLAGWLVHARTRHLRLTWLDLAVLALLLWELIGLLRTGPGGWPVLARLTGDVAFYVAGRAFLGSGPALRTLAKMVTLAAGTLAGLTVLFAAGQAVRLGEVGGLDPTAAKHLLALPLAAAPSGEWMSVFLALLSFPLVLAHDPEAEPGWRGWAVLTALALVLSVLVSFSRGIYAALAVPLLASLWLALRQRTPRSARQTSLVFLVATVLLGSFLLATPLRGPVLTTVKLMQTTSQVRSFEGRKAVWSTSLALVRQRPFLGGGIGRFPWLYAQTVRQGDGARAVGRAFSLPLEIMVERGVVGLLLFALLPVLLLRSLLRRRDGDDQGPAVARLWCAAGVLSLLARDASYCSVLASGGVSGAFFLLLGLGEGTGGAPGPCLAVRPRLAAIAIPVFALLPLGTVALTYAELRFSSFVDALGAGDREGARRDLDAAIRWAPGQAYYRLARAVLLQSGRPPVRSPEMRAETSDQTLADCRRALELEPAAARGWHCVGWVALSRGRGAEAVAAFSRAVRLEPDLAVYRIDLGLAQERAGATEAALGSFQRAIELAPRVAQSPFFAALERRLPAGRARSLVAQAAAALEAEQRRSPDPLTQARLGALDLLLARTDEGRRALEAALAALPSLPRPQLLLASLALRDGDRPLARRLLLRATRLDGGDSLAWAALGAVLEQDGERGRAVEAWRYATLAAATHRSDEAGRARRLWGVRRPLPDDLLPAGLAAHVDPGFDLVAPCQRLRALAPGADELRLCPPDIANAVARGAGQ